MQVIKVAEAHKNNHFSSLEKLRPSNYSDQQTNPSQQPTPQPNNVPTHAFLSPNQQHYNDQESSPHPYMLANLVNPTFNVPTINQPWQASSGIYCFIDASTTPELGLSCSRAAGLGIYIVDMQVQPMNSIYIRAVIQDIHSVVAAESAALSLAVVVIHRMNYHGVFFFSDCANLVDFLHSPLQEELPDWRMNNSLQIIQDYTRDRMPHFFKIDRELNSTTDNLAKLDFNYHVVQYGNYVPSCSHELHVPQCKLIAALSSLPFVNTRVLAASCC
jgi:hypothetical protein